MLLDPIVLPSPMKTFAPIEIFLVAGSIYLLINFLITRGIKAAENKLSPDLA